MNTHLGQREWQIAIVLVLLLGGSSGLWWWLHRRAAPIVWQGYAEADYIKVGPTQPGQLTKVLVVRGGEVAVGAALFTQDDSNERAARDQAAHQLDQAKQQLANLENGGKLTDIQLAEANLDDVRATLVRTRTDLQRNAALMHDGYVTKQNFDLANAAYLSAQAKVTGDEAALAQLRSPLGRTAEITAQDATAQAARSALDMAEWHLAQRSVAAPAGGRIADVLAQPGETLAAGAPVVSLLAPANIFVRFFIPEAALSTIHRGDGVALACDGCPKGLAARVSFISPQAEYTPPLIYSESSRAKLVFLVEARSSPDQASRLNPGQPIEVRPLATQTPP